MAAVYVALHLLLAWVSYVRPQFGLGITPWSPQAGLTLAFLVFCGSRWFPVAVLAAFLSEWWVRGVPEGILVCVLGSLWVGGAYAMLANLLKKLDVAGPFDTAKQAARFAGTVVAGTLVIAAIHVVVFLALRGLASSDALAALARYWIGDLNGVLSVMPLLAWLPTWRIQLPTFKRHQWEIPLQMLTVVGVVCVIFMLPAPDQLRFFYLLFVPITWIALRWSWPGATLAVLVVQFSLLVAAERGFPTARYIDIQFLMLTVTLTGLLLGAIVAERAKMLQRVGMREAEQRALLEMAPDAVLAVDATGTIKVANTAAARMFGERATAEPALLTHLIPRISLESAEGRTTLEGRRGDGRIFPAEVAWSRLDAPASEAFLVTVRDATDRRIAEEQIRERDAALARAMRFAVAGELASALAHELNQPITALVSYLRASQILAARTVTDDERLKGTLNKAAREAIRAAEVLRRLRDFYQGGAHKLEDVNISSVCESVFNAFQERFRRHDVALSLRLQPGLPNLACDSTQIEIVLHNLLANALDAVLQVPGAHRHIAVTATALRESIVVTVEDSGRGIPPVVAQKLFEPFTTSKPDGMGLGLAISRSLIRTRGGDLCCAHSSGLGGAAFIMSVPLEVPVDPPFR